MRNGHVATLLACCALAACGGGGDGGSTAPDQAQTAAGIWNASDASILVTPNGEVWGVDNSLRLIKAGLAVSGSQVSGSGSVYDGSSSVAASYTGSVQGGSALSVVLASGGTTTSRNFSYSSTFDQAPSLAALAGKYKGLKGEVITLAAGGGLAGSDSTGCTFSGSAAADSSGKNFYRVSVTFGAAPCALPKGTASGVIVQGAPAQLVYAITGGSFGTADVLAKQ